MRPLVLEDLFMSVISRTPWGIRSPDESTNIILINAADGRIMQ